MPLDRSLDRSRSSREYPSDPACYELLEDCGRGVSATVHRAACMATNEIVAVKKMNLERVSMSLVSFWQQQQAGCCAAGACGLVAYPPPPPPQQQRCHDVQLQLPC